MSSMLQQHARYALVAAFATRPVEGGGARIVLGVWISSVLQQHARCALMAIQTRAVEGSVAPGVLGVDISSMFQQHAPCTLIPHATRFVEGSFALVVRHVGVSSMLQQQAHYTIVATATRPVERSVAMIVLGCDVGTFTDEIHGFPSCFLPAPTLGLLLIRQPERLQQLFAFTLLVLGTNFSSMLHVEIRTCVLPSGGQIVEIESW
mmetsp:Transcript_40642/g.95521  ORF Transcript_40642/g.95521 Transcript_40642/m.95521 type:complete len:206 (-) Transcript_40642:7-624(-)